MFLQEYGFFKNLKYYNTFSTKFKLPGDFFSICFLIGFD
jgi:hypothetical protein